MAEAKQDAIARFGGRFSSLHPRLLPPNRCQDSLNTRTEDGQLICRYGYRLLTANPSGTFEGCAGIDYIAGFNTVPESVEEYISFEQVNGILKPYSRMPSNGARTEIKDGTTALNLTSGSWFTRAFNRDALCARVGGPVYRHTIGDYTSFVPFDSTQPINPTANMAITFDIDASNQAPTPSTQIDWTGAVAGNFADTSSTGMNADFIAVAGGSSQYIKTLLAISFTAVGGSYHEFEYDLTGSASGVQNWDTTNIRKFRFDVYVPFGQQADLYDPVYGSHGEFWVMDPQISSVQVWVSNDDATPKVLEMDVDWTITYNPRLRDKAGNQIGPDNGFTRLTVTAAFPSTFTEADWDNLRKFKIRLTDPRIKDTAPPALSPTFAAFVGPFIPDAVSTADPTVGADAVEAYLGYAYYNSEREIESLEVFPTTLAYQVEENQKWYSADDKFLGNVPNVAAPASTESQVDQVRYYIKFTDDNIWRLISSEPDDGAYYPIDLPFGKLRVLPERDLRYATPIGNVTCMCNYKSWIVYGKPGGLQNIVHSAAGRPWEVDDARNLYEDGDETAPATYDLVGDYSDEPLAMYEVGDVLVIIGKSGVSAQINNGRAPYSASFPKRLPGAIGGFSLRSSCRWRDEGGNWCVVYVSADGGSLYKVYVGGQLDGNQGELEQGLLIRELSAEMRGLMREWLFDGSAPSESLLQVGVCELDGSLWVAHGRKALIRRRPDPVTGEVIGWEQYEYTEVTAGVNFVKWCWSSRWFSPVLLESTGDMSEVEYDRSANFVPIIGDLRDRGLEVTGYWRSKDFSGGWRAIGTMKMLRENQADEYQVTVISDRLTKDYFIRAQKFSQRALPVQQGYDHSFKIHISSRKGAVTAFLWETLPVGGMANR